jgi:hypothetical protein
MRKNRPKRVEEYVERRQRYRSVKNLASVGGREIWERNGESR